MPPAPRRIDQVEPGFYKIRRVRRGPWMPAEIRIEAGIISLIEPDTDPVTHPEADYMDLVADCVTEGEAFRHPIVRVAWFGQKIDAAEHAHLLRLVEWAKQNPTHPMANPNRPISMRDMRITDLF